MRPIKVTPKQAEILDLLCELGETDLIAYKMKLSPRTVTIYINKIMEENYHPNRVTLALQWDRQRRSNSDNQNKNATTTT